MFGDAVPLWATSHNFPDELILKVSDSEIKEVSKVISQFFVA
jgi:hypothetical protein